MEEEEEEWGRNHCKVLNLSTYKVQCHRQNLSQAETVIAGVVFNFLYPSSFNYCLNPRLPAGQSLHNDFWERELHWGGGGGPTNQR